MQRLNLFVSAILALLVLSATTTEQLSANDALVVESASSVLREFMALPAKQIPTSLLDNAKGVAIIPRVVKGGLVVGVYHGKGVLLTRDAQNRWQVPIFASFSGGGIGWQAGIQSTDLILVFNTDASVRRIYEGKLTIGVDAAAAAGPLGRQANVATDTTLTAEIFSYSRSRGLFVGLSVDGSALQIDAQSARAFYQIEGAGQILPLPPTAVVPKSASRLVAELTKYSDGKDTVEESTEPLTVVQPNITQPLTRVQPANATDAVRAELVASAGRMNALVDADWRSFLALPKELTAPGGTGPTPDALAACLRKYDSIADDPQYAALNKRQEFIATRRLLRDYYDIVTARGSSLNLPRPPGSR